MKKECLRQKIVEIICECNGFRSLSRKQQIWNLSGQEGESPYGITAANISNLTQLLDDIRNEFYEIRYHEHVWNENGRCNICGIDGNA